MIPFDEFSVGQQIKIFDSFEQSGWPQDDINDWDEDDEEIFGILGKILTISELRSGTPRHLAFMTKEGYEVFREDVEYIVGGYGDTPDFEAPDVSRLSSLLFA